VESDLAGGPCGTESAELPGGIVDEDDVTDPW
jgi:hypothetical protein